MFKSSFFVVVVDVRSCLRLGLVLLSFCVLAPKRIMVSGSVVISSLEFLYMVYTFYIVHTLALEAGSHSIHLWDSPKYYLIIDLYCLLASLQPTNGRMDGWSALPFALSHHLYFQSSSFHVLILSKWMYATPTTNSIDCNI